MRTTEASCPFCKAALDDVPRAARPLAPRGVSRAAALAFGATLAVAGCGGGTTGPIDASTESGPDDSGGGGAKYGGPPIDSGPDDDGSPVAKYGGPPIDSGSDTGPDDSGGGGTKYGGPPIDSGAG